MIHRKILEDLKKWRKSANRKPLVLRGARQVGKTTVVTEFGKQYRQYIHLNLEKSKDAGFFTQYGDDVRKIFEAIMLARNLKNRPAETLLFIDEIQEVPRAIHLLRYFYEDMPELHVISAGSLLELALGKVKSFPVGRVLQMPVHPLDFEEFLMAMGEEIALEYYRGIPIPDLAVNKLLTLFNEFIIVGGMPEVVDHYRKNGRLITAVTEVYSSIWDNYRDDIEKYSESSGQRNILRHILDFAPQTQDRITFHGFGNSSYPSKEVSDAFRSLHKTGLIRLIYPTNELRPPLKPNLRRKPKIQFVDTGLMNYAAGIQSHLLKLEDLNKYYKGYLVNHMVFQEKIAQSKRINQLPFFWTREKANSNAEVDWVHPFENTVFPVEIKSGASGRLRSLMEFIDRSGHSVGFRLLANKVSIETLTTISGKPMKLVNLPYFCGGMIEGYIKWVLDSEG
nr:ATP-binding protein [Saprospiraceae bacterium]